MKLDYSFIPVPREIYNDLNESELKVFLHLLDNCNNAKNKGKVYFRSILDLSKDMGWCATDKRKINIILRSLQLKGLIKVTKGDKGRGKATEYQIIHNTLKEWVNTYDKKGENSTFLIDEKKGEKSTPILKTYTIYTMEYLMTKLKMSESDKEEMLKELEGYIKEKVTNEKENEMSENRASEMNDKLTNKNTITSKAYKNTINTMEYSTAPAADRIESPQTAPQSNESTEVEQQPTDEANKAQAQRKQDIQAFNSGHDEHRHMLFKAKTQHEWEYAKKLIDIDKEYVNNTDWSDTAKQIWRDNFDYWLDRSEKTLHKIYNRIYKVKNV